MRGKSGLWWIFFLVLVLASPLLEGGETYHTIIWLRLWVIGFALYYILKPLGKGALELVYPRGSWLLVLMMLLAGASLFTTHYYYITAYHFANLLVYFLLFFLCLGLLGKERNLAFGLVLILNLALWLEICLGLFEYFWLHPARVRGSFFNPAYYAGYLLALIPFPLYALFYGPEILGERGKKLLVRLGFGIIFLCGLFALFASGSRVAVFSLVPLGVVLLARYRLRALVVLLALFLGIIFFPNPFQKRLKTINRDPYAWERITIWKTSLRMIQHHPYGVGLGMYQYYYPRYAYPLKLVEIGRYGKKATRAHNEILHYACELSPVFPLLGLGFLSWFFICILKFIRRAEIARAGRLSGFLGSFLGIFIHSLVDSNLHQPPIMILAILDLAVLFSLVGEEAPFLLKEIKLKLAHPRIMQGVLGAGGVLVAGVISFQTLGAGLYFQAMKIKDSQIRKERLRFLSQLPFGYAPIYYQLAVENMNLFFQEKDFSEAAEASRYFKFATQLNSENYFYFQRWGEFLYQLSFLVKGEGLLLRAEKLVKKSLKLAPSRVKGYFLLAKIDLARGELGKAQGWLERALSYEPYYLPARALLVRVLWERGERESARGQYQELVRFYQEGMRELSLHPRIYNSYQVSLLALDNSELEELAELVGMKED